MRIIAGEFKGRIIESPSEKTTRPTTDRVRESIFSSIYSRLPELADVDVLDAFAGAALWVSRRFRVVRTAAPSSSVTVSPVTCSSTISPPFP